eukprot:TRINITY_DN1878_c0_g1_i1.p1 TRINITY_DN1878_c0_g1~~TRINITY_DN1878_c0_g1_i1.p1  ORF type:complete len:333 (+),score=77.48 TRINITY_DN1878_c0_g1_i1:76-1074(+)
MGASCSANNGKKFRNGIKFRVSKRIKPVNSQDLTVSCEAVLEKPFVHPSIRLCKGSTLALQYASYSNNSPDKNSRFAILHGLPKEIRPIDPVPADVIIPGHSIAKTGFALGQQQLNSPSLELKVPDIASLHAKIQYNPSTRNFSLNDLGSKDGTYLAIGHGSNFRRPYQFISTEESYLQVGSTTIEVKPHGSNFAPDGTFSIRIVAGPDVGNVHKVKLSPNKPILFIGRLSSCDVPLADRHVSRHHLVIVRRVNPQTQFVEYLACQADDCDKSSFFRLKSHSQRRLARGDIIKMGLVRLVVDLFGQTDDDSNEEKWLAQQTNANKLLLAASR